MFKFGIGDDIDGSANQSMADSGKLPLEWIKCKELSITDDQIASIDSMKNVQSYICSECVLSHVDPKDATKLLLDDIEELEHSDLLPAKYEGGLKIWECTSDLIDYMQKESSEVYLAGKNVLDLGCGTGLLGIFALVLKGANVHFQDYNEEVLTSVTMPNVLLNVDKEDMVSTAESCRFFAGDWDSLADLVCPQKYDFILTSETIYNPDNHAKLHATFKKVLKKTGVIFLAAKTYYFGVGGGLRQFEKVIQSDDVLQSCVVWKCSYGVQREILRITFKKNKPC